jgi:leukotriene-A4 hydrolase
VFLQRLQTFPALPGSHLEYLAKVYHFSMTPNAEIRLRFYSLVLKDPKAPVAQTFAIEAAKWVTGEDGSGVIKGRMKFCRPVLRAVGKVDINLAMSMFEKKKNAFHPIARKLIEKV